MRASSDALKRKRKRDETGGLDVRRDEKMGVHPSEDVLFSYIEARRRIAELGDAADNDAGRGLMRQS